MNKSRIFLLLLVLMFIFFTFRLIQLQILDYEKNSKLALDNAARLIPVLAPRGVIFDRNGNILVQNRPVFMVYVLPHLLPKNPNPVFEKLGNILRIPKGVILKRFKERKTPIFEGILIARDVPVSVVSEIDEMSFDLPGVEVLKYPLRSYPNKQLAAHVLGFVGEITKEELSLLKDDGYRLGDLIGKDGVDKVYDEYLRGTPGGKRLEVDALGYPVRILEKLNPIPGDSLVLTIDNDLQKKVEDLLGYKEGAVVVLDPNNGEILAMASSPTYDSSKKWEEISKKNHPFMNRAISSYPPGSTFKPVTLSAALEEKVTRSDEMFYCSGAYRLGTRIAKCWKLEGHKSISVLEGLVQSCDVVFYELGRRLGPTKLKKYAKAFGLGEKIGVDLPGEKNGFIPDPEWKEERFGEKWYVGDSINIGIGQGYIQVTPLQLACMYGQIALGKRMKPFVVKKIITSSGEAVFENKPYEISPIEISSGTLGLIRDALHKVVIRGTGINAFVASMEAAGKTGTAENRGVAHAWFVAYAPYNNPKIVVVAFIAHGAHGDRVSALITRDIFEWYLKNRTLKTALQNNLL
ncbi:penicillin-binding protein 2 [candidate division WOR-1 bacterium RIFOXYA2_FULL_36_21]|uniref:Penicillin-binding protein 2 n=1 Tax=candidate division WOR-1 bacterium RIFOXYB2_FULL_36_35 TaxID=1802578 RepID=A0A1F4S5D4_UNCSA|nr:MAG: penicillin-binding protein 2 [candidate division WOR-1 bacterium RIFOXYA2_FULL_36_21]OGC15648.1 MAG: penicillin-binding protein 2 [candidate division WOR-1 bacterium RIFOXYB2_FULL_36_35]OGC16402.1 MAG: penicillin-binding protein 2 [candidate division WOR-1 bacterium RIFOXYA12_FULL_36_13]